MKNSNNTILTILLILFLIGDFPFPSMAQLPDHQYVEINQSPEWEIYPGQRKNLEVNIAIVEGYYIQSDHVKEHNLTPTSITTVEAPFNMVVYSPVFPEPKSIKLRDAQDSIRVYQHSLRIYIPVEVKNEAKTGQHKIAMNLQYQACDSIQCFSPRNLPFMINVVVNERTPFPENE